MQVKAIEFTGRCGECPWSRSDNNTSSRGAVEFDVESGTEVMLCLQCASRLAARILKKVEECKRRRKAGQEYRWDKWSKRKKENIHERHQSV